MSWSQSRIRKWQKDNPGRSRVQVIVSRAFRKNRRALVGNLVMDNPLLKYLGLK